jgi:uncharacterized repeat protein (TIGR03803 family)
MKSPIMICLVAVVVCALPATAASYRVVHSFNANSAGAFPGGAGPAGGVIEDSSGNLYGTAVDGGAKTGCGVIFQLRRTQTTLKPKFAFKKLFGFCQKKPVGGIFATGQYPYAPVVFGTDGALYGTTLAGGAHDAGTVYTLAQNGAKWDMTVLHDFDPDHADGSYSLAGLAVDATGALYGTTYVGGSAASRGAVFKLTPLPGGWSYDIIYAFTGGADGGNPRTGVTIDDSGNLYGVATSGGDSTCRCGVIYKLSPVASGWTEEVLHTFTFGEGLMSNGPLSRDAYGTLYAVSGANDGAVFKLAPSGAQWNASVLYTFTGSNNDGRLPYGEPIFDQSGALYGTTAFGGDSDKGTVYKLTPDANGWTKTTLHSFSGAPKDGSNPEYAALLHEPGGTIYGTTGWGGKSEFGGIVFELVP